MAVGGDSGVAIELRQSKYLNNLPSRIVGRSSRIVRPLSSPYDDYSRSWHAACPLVVSIYLARMRDA